MFQLLEIMFSIAEKLTFSILILLTLLNYTITRKMQQSPIYTGHLSNRRFLPSYLLEDFYFVTIAGMALAVRRL